MTPVYRLLALIRSLWRKVLSRLRRAWLPVQAGMEGGSVVLGRGVSLQQAVVFQGRGRLEVAEGAVLGFALAGSPAAPLVLQPREPGAVIRIGAGAMLTNGIEMIARSGITIGAGCRIGPRCVFYDADFHALSPEARGEAGETQPIVVGRNVWFGSEVMVLKGVTIGDDAVIAARALVTADVPAGAVAAGTPARVIGSVYA